MTAAKMSAPTIMSKDNVQCLEMRDAKDIKTVIGARYYCWVLGSMVEDDALYMTKSLKGPPSRHSIKQIQGALARVPNEIIFPLLPIPWWFARTGVTVSDSWDDEPDPDVYYLKRPWVAGFGTDNGLDDGPLANWFACEIRNLEQLARHPPHPHLVRYHGCRVRRGHITGVLLGRVKGGTTLDDYAKAGKTVPDKPAFLRALASAVHHLHHVVGLVHNDIHPANIMVSPDGSTPTLIDLGSALPDGEEMLQCQPFSCWGKDPLDLDPETHYYGPLAGLPTSRRSRDLAALERLRTWLDDYDFTTDNVQDQVDTEGIAEEPARVRGG
ncbi:kinase-like domain-containing protein [Podospora aff. communis PSN243]|uniref:Kinase-like domain-containing protein n=1 Tax=Podospora aff. communis PSN243 TaxID=3040156 RepID=A0AAV9GBH6_9PEZI|nr:kinase-like domain-containing protein [Podospora aff. communis PSN243]